MIYRNKGFTIIELITVITVIGILAGITIVSYGTWRTTTAQNEVKSNLSGVVSAMESSRNFNSGYPLSIPSTIPANPNVTLVYVRGSATDYCVTGTSTVVNTVVYYVGPSYGTEAIQGTCP